MVKLSHSILQSVLKPSRYTGGELNSVIKDWNNIGATIALSMPDVYEVGMSNLGLQILYEIVNSSENFVAERVYAPWIDMEDLMRENDIPLFSLESRREIISFDLLGFSLQYEMIYTNVLNMLDLAKIPLYSKERSIDMPFVVGGGPCVYNVEPIADFFDFFIIGEGEEVILEVLAMMSEWKSSGKQGGRKGFLELIMSISGVYVPQYYKPQYNSDGCFVQMQALSDKAKIPVYKRVVANLNNVKFLDKPIVPNMDIIHNRLMLELFRGCSKGCRFCQAGMCYRPVRERSKEKLINLSKSLVDSTGYDEMSLTSLSSADYSCLDDLVDNLMVEFQQERVSFSLPSLRIDSFSVDLAYKMQQIRKSGLTFAPEAGTQRLRDVINKGVTEEDLLKACAAAFRQGWKKVKLYFMMGLPTETDEDILGIADLGKKVVDLYTSIVGHRGCNVTISVSCLVPKPFTPFQWFGQLPVAEFQRRQRLLKEAIKDKAITFNYHDAKLSIIEGIMARGDRRLSKVIYTAWKNGAKFDGWSDLFKFEVWDEALRECNINGEYYSERNRDMCEALPWSHTSPGVTERFLYNEWQKAMLASLTIDCRREVCTGCGVCPQLQVNIIDFYDKKTEKIYNMPKPIKNNIEGRYYYRARITKGTELRYTSHLDLVKIITRAFFRSKLPMAYSEGFNPHMKLSFASALSLGVTSEAEYMDFELTHYVSKAEIITKLSKVLPLGISLQNIDYYSDKPIALMSLADEAKYMVTFNIFDNNIIELAKECIHRYNRADTAIYKRVTPKKKRAIETKDYVKKPIEIDITNDTLMLAINVSITPTGTVKPIEIIELLISEFNFPLNVLEADIIRVGMYNQGNCLMNNVITI